MRVHPASAPATRSGQKFEVIRSICQGALAGNVPNRALSSLHFRSITCRTDIRQTESAAAKLHRQQTRHVADDHVAEETGAKSCLIADGSAFYSLSVSAAEQHPVE